MSSSNLARWGGLAVVAGGVLLVLWAFLLIPMFGPTMAPGSVYQLSIILWSLSWLLLVGSLIGLYARQANASGWLGPAGLRTLVRDGRERPETRTCRMRLAAEGSSVRGASDVQRMSADMCSMQVFAESF